jgi:hypothetical protein
MTSDIFENLTMNFANEVMHLEVYESRRLESA